MNKNNKQLWLVAAFAVVYIVWGTTYLAMKIGLETIPPFTLGAIRYLVAGLGTFAVLRLIGVANPSLRQWRSASIVGLFLMVGGNGLVMVAIEHGLPSGIAAVIVATMPLWMVVFDWLFYRGSRPGLIVFIGLIIGFVGIVLLTDPFGSMDDSAALSVVACLICMMAPLFWSLGSLHSRKMDLPDNVLMSVAVQMLSGAVVFSLITLLTGELNGFDFGTVSWRSILAIAHLILFGSILALPTYMWLLRNAPAARVSTYTYVNPVIAVLLGWLVLSEVVTAQMWGAISMVLIAVVLIVSNRSNTKATGKPQDDQSPGSDACDDGESPDGKCTLPNKSTASETGRPSINSKC